MEQLNPDEINSLLQQSGDVPICVDCSCDILSFNTNGGLRQHIKCQECVQLATSSQGVEHSSRRDHGLAHNVDRKPMLPQEDSENESASKSYSSISDLSTYPSKLKAVLSDIVEYQSEEKR